MGPSAPLWSAPRGTPDAPWSITGLRLTLGRREQVLAAVMRTAELLGWESVPLPGEVADHRGARAVLGRAWQSVTDVLGSCPAEPGRLAVLVDLLGEIRAAEDGVRDDQADRQASTAQVVREALSGLRDVRSVAELAERAPGAASTIGFDRVLLSRIDESTWVPESMFVTNDAKWADEIVQAGREHLRTLDNSLLETQIVRRNRPLVVTDTSDRPNLHRAMIDASQTRSYTAAPIAAWGRVIGFLHADCFRQSRHLDGTDRDLLWMFCDGLGHMVTRTAALDAVESLRGELDRLAAGVRSFGWDAGWPGGGDLPERAATAGARPGSPRRFAESGRELFEEVEGVLTRREVEVMRLMGAGHTNAQIARRLVISEGTVKSHVKHILRKLQAANRAEAVSRWLREEHARQARVRPEQPARVGA